jgi:hypothetical protein
MIRGQLTKTSLLLAHSWQESECLRKKQAPQGMIAGQIIASLDVKGSASDA